MALAFAPEARAQSDEQATETTATPLTLHQGSVGQPATREHWYGWQTLTVDGASMLVLQIGAAGNNDRIALAALGGYALGPPIVHAAHDRWGIAVADVLVRVGAPFLGGMIGAGTATHQNDDDVGAAVVGILIGYAAAVTLDAAVFARETVPVHETPEATGFSWSPSLGVTTRGATAGVTGRF
jgi:hypothetical protein